MRLQYALLFLLVCTSASAQYTEIRWIREGRTTSIPAVTFSPDGRTIAAANENGTIRLWDIASGRVTKVIPAQAVAVAFSSDGRHLATGSELIEVATGRSNMTFNGHAGGFAAFSPDGERLATGNNSGVSIFEVWTGRRLRNIAGHIEKTGSSPWSPDGSLIAVATTEYRDEVRIHDSRTGELKRKLSNGVNFPARSLAWVPGTSHVVVASTWSIMLWDAATGDTIRSFWDHNNIYSLAVSANGTYVADASGNGNGSVSVWRIATGERVMNVPAHDFMTYSVAFSADETRLATSSDDGTVKIFEVPSGRLVKTLTEAEGTRYERAYDVALTSNGVAAGLGTYGEGTQGGSVMLLDRETGKPVTGFSGAQRLPIFGVAADGDPDLMAIASGELKIVDAQTGALIRELVWPGRYPNIDRAAFSMDGRSIVGGGGPRQINGSNSPELLLWDATTGDTIRAMGRGSIPIFIGDSLIAAATDSGEIVLWDPLTGLAVDTLAGHAPERTLALEMVGNSLVSGGSDGLVKVWRLGDGELELTIPAHDGPVLSLADAPYAIPLLAGSGDGSVASGGEDGLVKLWHLHDGSLVYAFEDYRLPQVALAADFNEIYSVTSNGAVIRWQMAGSGVRAPGALSSTIGILSSAPNPASTTATIRFELKREGSRTVRLALYDMRGVKVGTTERSIASMHGSLTIDVSSLPGGNYLYRLDDGQSSAGGTIVVAR